ncbi:MAG: hypothetical protein HUU20_15280 [Pirellulales bacterium]|nr:hypothetical protein [Pirellulales bacterium]
MAFTAYYFYFARWRYRCCWRPGFSYREMVADRCTIRHDRRIGYWKYIVGQHASERLEERGIMEWQAVAGRRMPNCPPSDRTRSPIPPWSMNLG